MSQRLLQSPRTPLVFLLSALCLVLCCVLALSPRTAVASPTEGYLPPDGSARANAKCPDEFEPNESFATAWPLDINTGYSAYICDGNDLDYFQFFVDDNCHIDTYLTSLPINVDLFLYDQSGYLVGSSTNGDIYDEVIDYDVGKGGPFVILARAPKGEFDPDNPYKFGMDVSCAPPATETATPTEIPTATPTSPPICPDAYEPNNWFGEAWPVSTGEDHFAYTCYEGDVDYFSFEVQDNCNIQAQVFPQTIDVDLYLLDPDGNVIGSSWSPGTENEWIDSTRSTGGVYVILVEPKKGEYSAEYSYKFRIDLWCAPPQTDTPTPTWTVIEPSPTHTATPSATLIEPSPTRTATPSATVIEPSPTRTATPSATLIGPSPTGTATPSATLIEPSPTPTATFTPPPPSMTPASCPDPYEPNDAFKSAWEILPGDLNSFICGPTDQDWFQFAVQLHDTVEVSLQDLPANYDLYLYDGGHVERRRSDNTGTKDENILVSDAPIAGQYRVLVSTGGDSNRTLPYRLRLQITPGSGPAPTNTTTPPDCLVDAHEPNDTYDTAADVIGRDIVYGVICPQGDVDFYQIFAWSGVTISLLLDSLPANYDLYLWSPAGIMVAHSSNSRTASESITYIPAIGGIYCAEVRPAPGEWNRSRGYELYQFGRWPTPTVTLTPTQTLTPTRTPTGEVDLTIQYIEVNQAIQTDPPAFDPLSDKPTVVRVYVSTNLAPGYPCVPHVKVRLDVVDESGVTVLRTLSPYNPNGEICAPASPDWRNLNDALNFDLPADMLQGTWVLRPYVNHDRRVIEVNYDNNRDMVQLLQFRQASKHLSIAYVPIHYHPEGYTGATDPTSAGMSAAVQFLKATWPLRPDYVSYHPAALPALDYVGAEDDLPAILAGMWARMDPQPDHLFGWLPGDALRILPTVVGRAYIGFLPNPMHTGWAMDLLDGGVILAHELEHNYGFLHSCNSQDGRGFDVLHRQVKWGTYQVICMGLMGAERHWADAVTYGAKLTAWQATLWATALQTGTAQAIAPTRYVIASGVITTSGSAATAGALAPLEWVTRTLTADVPEGAAYCLEFRSSTQAVLQRSCFDTPETCGSTEYEPESFLHILPWPEGTTRVLLTEGATVLAQRAASAHPPTVQVLAPNGGDNWDGPLAVSWSGSDPDGDPLSYSVLYSPNGGVSWVPLAAQTTLTTLTADSGYLAGGELGLVKVRASDGFQTAEDVSDAPFTVPRKPPEVTIGAPLDGGWYRAVEYINLMGQAYDPEDGIMADGSLTWYLRTETSSTALGTGPLLTVGPLPVGDHVIVLDVVDSDGMEGTDRVTIHVGEQPAQTVYLPVVLKRR